jgi:uncharacterized protein (TIGR02145 family)
VSASGYQIKASLIASQLLFGALCALYDYKAVKVGALCPLGWHIPTLSEWTTLIEYLGG